MAILRGTNASEVIIGDGQSDIINGFGGDDVLIGNFGNDVLHGDTGNDALFGNEGNDVLDGGLDLFPDTDRLDGGTGIDTATYSQVQHAVTVNLVQGLAFGAGSVDTLVSIENVTGTNFNDSIVGNLGANVLQGAGGNDFLDGLAGNDFISAGSGNDFIKGGAGVDKIFGGSGADRFMYNSTADSGVGAGNRDVITGFEHGVDKIDLQAVDAKVGVVGNQAFTFIGSSSFTAEGQVRAFFDGTNTIVRLNTSGATGAESEIQLSGNVTLTASDFVL
jgi:Ca2+-binding RTX toxin-like protein